MVKKEALFLKRSLDDNEIYIHRSGRTGRAGEKGKAITLATQGEWASHRLFRQARKNFIASEIASKSELQGILTNRFIQGIKELPFLPE